MTVLKYRVCYCCLCDYLPTYWFPGSYCDQEELSSVAGPCTAGYFCTLGATRADPQADVTGGLCPTGAYCPTGTGVPELCPAGMFSNATGNTDYSDCKLCTAGKNPGTHLVSLPVIWKGSHLHNHHVIYHNYRTLRHVTKRFLHRELKITLILNTF